MGETILIADDSAEIRNFLEETVLKPSGYTVYSVGDGMSARTLIRELQPDLVLTDEHMPSLKGLDLIRRVKRDLPMLPVILMTAEGSETLAVEAMRAGASDYLVKPFDAEHLLAAVGRAMTIGRRGQDVLKVQAESRAGAPSLERRLHELE